jgi:NAD(P)-dependent dehydrogenase (short-subunit alcohol dehydrogenase family)
MVLQSQADDRKSPYYSMVHFSLMMPLAIVHTLVSHTVLWLRGGTTAPNIEQQQPSLLQVDRYYPWQEATYTSTSPTDNATASSISNGVAIVTGSNTGIGFQTARALVLEHDMIVILACRSRDKAAAAVAKINNELAQRQQQQQQQQGSTTTTTTRSGAKAIFVHPLDLSSFDSVREFARVVRQQYKEIHVLVNNAGRNSRGTAGQSSIEKVVVNGANGEQEIVVELELDLLFQSNFLGHFLLTRLLLHENAFAKNARIVNLSSVMHHFCGGVARLDLESAQGWKSVAMAHQPPYDTYSFSKLAAILFTIEHNRRHHIGTSTMIRSIAVNPGAV